MHSLAFILKDGICSADSTGKAIVILEHQWGKGTQYNAELRQCQIGSQVRNHKNRQDIPDQLETPKIDIKVNVSREAITQRANTYSNKLTDHEIQKKHKVIA